MENPEAILRAAETVAGILQQHRVEAVVIGAVALAACHEGLEELIADAR